MAWFKKTRKPMATPAKEKPSRVPEGLWVKCPDCAQAIYNKDLAANLNVCPKCAHHFRINAAERLRLLFDGEWVEYDSQLMSTDPLGFTDTKPYKSRLKMSIEATGRKDAVIAASWGVLRRSLHGPAPRADESGSFASAAQRWPRLPRVPLAVRYFASAKSP